MATQNFQESLQEYNNLIQLIQESTMSYRAANIPSECSNYVKQIYTRQAEKIKDFQIDDEEDDFYNDRSLQGDKIFIRVMTPLGERNKQQQIQQQQKQLDQIKSQDAKEMEQKQKDAEIREFIDTQVNQIYTNQGLYKKSTLIKRQQQERTEEIIHQKKQLVSAQLDEEEYINVQRDQIKDQIIEELKKLEQFEEEKKNQKEKKVEKVKVNPIIIGQKLCPQRDQQAIQYSSLQNKANLLGKVQMIKRYQKTKLDNLAICQEFHLKKIDSNIKLLSADKSQFHYKYLVTSPLQEQKREQSLAKIKSLNNLKYFEESFRILNRGQTVQSTTNQNNFPTKRANSTTSHQTQQNNLILPKNTFNIQPILTQQSEQLRCKSSQQQNRLFSSKQANSKGKNKRLYSLKKLQMIKKYMAPQSKEIQSFDNELYPAGMSPSEVTKIARMSTKSKQDFSPLLNSIF